MNAAFTPVRTVIDVDRYQQMIAAGIFRSDGRIELIGEMLDMAPDGDRHIRAVNVLTRLFIEAMAKEVAEVSVQDSVILGHFSEPQPDLLLLRPRADRYGTAEATAADVLRLVEVADSTLQCDRLRKIPLYARHGVREIWIIDVNGRRLERYREPRAGELIGMRVP